MSETSTTATVAAPSATKKTPVEGADCIGRTAFKDVGSADPKVYPFDTYKNASGVEVATPAGFIFGDNIPLKRQDFKSKRAYYLHKAEGAELEALKYRKAAETGELETAGAGGSVKKLQTMVTKTQQLMESLKAQGIDVDAIMAKYKADAAAAAKPKA